MNHPIKIIANIYNKCFYNLSWARAASSLTIIAPHFGQLAGKEK
jgi:hypothetical protein